ncbi:amino acid/amide ABC transporter substrate-binding protein, HAAT family [Haloechinothrix alba]|uniref:Amino acid/amide ABC transporter substrate-binding protein, HAAT family n=1 Tax=Haloechinothrix alba TaxID=664784 RepID=A0A238XKP6_9PSEU|nr:ABC transporter substrate-binding protein [Haloechinothrix alba]SNR58549.1 amino acid/amide ABC transporter substrate-binding protein, HAAT family [Haloechinothrix alba]
MHRRAAAPLATAAVTALTLAACGGPGAEEGDGDGPIPIGVISDLSGATADVGTPYSEGIRGYAEWLNEQGGIDGRELDLNLNDYAYDVARAEQLYSQYVNEGVVAVQGWGTGDTEALRQKVAQDELPFMSASYAETLVDPEESPYNFVVAATYSDQMRVALDWVASDSGGDGSVAVFHHDSPFGTAPVGDGEAYIEDNDLGLGYDSYAMPEGATDYVAQLNRAESAGAEYVVVQNVSSPAAMLATNIAQQNLDMTVVCLNWCADEQFIDLAGDAAEGHIMVQPFSPPSDPVEGHSEPADYLESQGESLEDKGLHYVQGWYTMHVMAEGIRHTIDSGQEVTGSNLRDALRSMDPVNTGEVTVPISFDADSHRGMEGTGIYQVDDGEMTTVERGVTP